MLRKSSLLEKTAPMISESDVHWTLVVIKELLAFFANMLATVLHRIPSASIRYGSI